MPAVRGDGMRGLAVFISDIRNCKSKEAEIKRINKELANIRSKFKGDKTLDGYQKKKYVCKLLFIFLLGHDIDFGHMEAVNLLSSNKYSEKQIGYLFISVLVNTNSDLIKLIIQSIKNDLASRNPIHVNLALQCIANIGSKEMAEAFGNEIPKLLVSGDTMDVVKQSAALCLLRLLRTAPDVVPGGEWTSRIVHLLNDQHLGVVTAAASLIDALVKRNPDEYKGCVSLAVSRLSRIVTSSYTDLQDYTYYFVPAPWLSVKLLRLLQNYTPPAEDPGVRGRLNECLETILNKAQEPPKSKKVQHSNAKNAVLFEAISLIIHNDSELPLSVRACNQLGQFLSNRETNLRYLALESMCHLATSELSHEAVKKHQEVVILSMKMEKDVSVRQQAVDLLYAMCDKSNAEEIVQEMLNYLETADYSIREEMVLKVAILAEKYATDYTWYVDVILNLIRIAGDYVSEEVWYRVIQIVINREDVQGYAAKTVFEALQAPACHENMVKVGGYILGEFGNLIAGDQRSSPAVQFQLLHSKYHLCSPMTRALLLSTYIKFVNLFPEMRSQIQDVFRQHSNLRSADAELQQRASEYLQLSIIASSDVLATVLEEMPAFPERESSILAVLKRKKPGRVPENEIRESKSPAPNTNHHAEAPSSVTGAVNNTSADLLSLSTPPSSQPSSNTGVLLDVLGDIYNMPNKVATNGAQNTYNPKKFVCKNNGVLFESELIQIGVKSEFEPYIVHVLPHLLLCFGDSSQYVRTATDDTARVVMSKLSAHGVKLVLPSLLAALEEDSWRTKTGSVELLGAMAYCAPKQLSSCLPSIVPKLIEVLSDSHTKVQEAGAEALKVIGSVIRNPEIQAIVPVLLKALQDPSHKTATCLQTLLDTQFVHFIDAPSLALIMPVVQRAFLDRSTETRKMAAQIIGNMYSLTDQKDLTPYLPTIIPGLKTSLLDPVPEVRSVSARALGAMVRGMGESSFEDLLPWLMQTLTSETSSVDRSGAAQGLSEVVRGLGVEKLHKLMPEIISTAERTDIAPHVKDGYIMMFIYMPSAFTTEFTPYIGQIINPILKALADENEYVRETALRAGQRIVNLYADSAIMLLLPELEKSLFDDNWRIRYSSVQLLGDLLYRISGVSGKMSTETASEDDNFGTEQSHFAIINALGAERRNRVLAGLYMGRSDVALMVRQAALHVWKVVVTNTPRTLREILPTLFTLLLGCLASTSNDKRQVAARTLGDLVRKLGERVLPEIIPILEKGLQSDQADQRQGVCIGLSEIMTSTNKDMVITFVISLVPTVRKALCDPLPEVRQAAAKTFDGLHSTVGVRALDDILPAMLTQLNSPDPAEAENTLDGLRQVMAIKSRVVLPYLVPQLTTPPVNTKALSILASVAGEALTRFLHKILPALLTALSSAQGSPNEVQELEYCQAVILSVTDEVGIRTVMDQLMEATRADDPSRRRSAATLLCAFCRDTRADYSQYVPQLLRGLIHLFTDDDKDVLQMSWEALTAVTKTLASDQQIAHVQDIRQAVRFAVSDLKGQELLPGFCLPKGITPILPIFREAILNGLPEAKEQAAQGLGEVIKLTSASALQPSVVHITGPLIRILGDRFNWSVKAAVLETLAILLGKVGVMLKQFLPQLQTTFLRALNDSNRQVRLKAAYALSNLIVIHTRVDPLFTELHAGIKTGDDPAIRETMLQALRGVLTPAGDKMTEPMKKQVFATLSSMLGHSEDITRNAVAGCFGALIRWLTPDQLNVAFNENLLCNDSTVDWMLRHGRSAALFVALKESPTTVYNNKEKDRVCSVILSYLSADRVQIVMNGVRACGYLFQYLMNEGQSIPQQILSPFVRSMNNNSNDVKQLLAKVCIHLARNISPEKMSPELLKSLLPMLVNGTKEKNGYVKANSELALIAVLRLRQGEEEHQRCMAFLDAGAKESLSDVVSKVLRKVLSQPEGKIEELDDTLLT